MITVAGLWVYPVKSVQGMAVDVAPITPEGSLRGDREWIVTDPGGEMLWQGDMGRMTLIRAHLAPERLRVWTPEGDAVEVEPRHGGAPLPCRQYGFDFDGVDAGDGAAALLSDFLGRHVRLVRVGDQAHRWPDVNPLHVLSQGSLDALNARLALGGEGPKDVMRFRPNVLLAGGGPWVEERTPVIDLGEARIVLREPATRCELVNISLHTGEEERQPLKTVAALSRERPHARRGSFGTYARAEGPRLAVGMAAA